MRFVYWFAGLFGAFIWALPASAVERGCHARYSMTVLADGRDLTDAVIPLQAFTARATCKKYHENTCRRRARDKAFQCMTAHSKSPYASMPKVCTGHVKNYPYERLINAVKKKACAIGSAMGHKKLSVTLKGQTWGDKRCGQNKVLKSNLDFTCGHPSTDGAGSVRIAQRNFSKRKHEIIQEWVSDLWRSAHAHGGDWQKAIGSFNLKGGIVSFRRIAAALYALRSRRLKRETFKPEHMPPKNFPKIVENWTKTIAKERYVGTSVEHPSCDPAFEPTKAQCHRLIMSAGGFGNKGIPPECAGGDIEKRRLDGKLLCGGDYDFQMKEMIALLYEFKADRQELTDRAVFNIVDRGFRHDWGLEWGDHMAVTAPVIGTIPETENHLLMIYGSQYLINDFIRENPRNLVFFRRGRYRAQQQFKNKGSKLEDFLLRAAGRVLHSGFFETNARPYQSKTFHAMLNLAEFAADERVRTAYRNALHYLSTKYTFQSFKGQRLTPARRNHKKNYTHNFNHLETDGMQMVMALLSGANPHVSPDRAGANGRGHALWAALSSYRLPEAIHDYMLRKRHGYWATMHARFTDLHFTLHTWPKYLDKIGRGWGNPRRIERAQEAYFATPEFMNVSGGYYERYKVKWDTGFFGDRIEAGARNLDFLAMPQVLLTPGLLHTWPGLDDLTADTLALPGEHARWYLSANSGTYKSFSYGYFHRDKKDRHLQWPQRVPATWGKFRYREGNRQEWPVNQGRAMFKFYDFTKVKKAVAGIPAGIYVVMARVSKSDRAHTYRHYARGFWEIVPKSRFPNVKSLKNHVLQKNPASHFQNATKGGTGKPYRYRMTNGDLVTLEDIIGSPSIKRCYSPIISVQSGRHFRNIKAERCTASVKAKQPLIRVEEIDPKSYLSTGNIIAEAKGDGILKVFNRHIKQGFIVDSSKYKQPEFKPYFSPIKEVLNEIVEFRCPEGRPDGAKTCKVKQKTFKARCEPGRKGCPYWIDTKYNGVFRSATRKNRIARKSRQKVCYGKKGDGKNWCCPEGVLSGAKNCKVASINFLVKDAKKCRAKQGRSKLPDGCTYWIDSKHNGVFRLKVLK